MIKLRNKDIDKLAEIINFPSVQIHQLIAMKLIDQREAINLLIKTFYKKLKTEKYATRHIIAAIMDEYSVSRAKVQSIIYNKRQNEYHCQKCGKKIIQSEYVRNNKICDSCVAKDIHLY